MTRRIQYQTGFLVVQTLLAKGTEFRRMHSWLTPPSGCAMGNAANLAWAHCGKQSASMTTVFCQTLTPRGSNCTIFVTRPEDMVDK